MSCQSTNFDITLNIINSQTWEKLSVAEYSAFVQEFANHNIKSLTAIALNEKKDFAKQCHYTITRMKSFYLLFI